ncbi:MAG: Fe-S cluster assembly protein SufD [Tepidiformaceae bacterium]
MSSAVEKLPGSGRLDVSASKALGERLSDFEAMAALRAAAAKLAVAMEMPRQVERPWKYLDVSTLSLDGYAPGVDAQGGDAPIVNGASVAALAQVNSETLSAVTRDPGVTVVDFADADDRQKGVIARHLGKVVVANKNKFTALHYAFLRGGVLVELAHDVEAKEPVRIVREYRAEKQLATPHTLIVAGANSRVHVIEDYRSGEGDMVAVPAVEIVPGPGAEVRYTVLHRWGANTKVFGEQRTITERDSAVVSLSVATGGRVVKSHITSSLEGRGSSSELFGLIVGDGREHIDFYTLQDHIGPDTRSDLLFKSALNGESRSVYYGMTRIGLGAQNADANQEDRNLLLSPMAKADSDPVLEILTNNIIRAAHGATAGPVDEDQLFYLESRGIPHEQAEDMLVHAFLGQVLDRVPDEALREELAVALDAKLAI